MALSIAQLMDITNTLGMALRYSYDLSLAEWGWIDRLSVRETTDDKNIDEPFTEDQYALKESAIGQDPDIQQILGGTLRVPLLQYSKSVRMNQLQYKKYLRKLGGEGRDVGRGAARMEHDSAIDTMNNGNTLKYVGSDGLPWFSATHPKGGGVLDNFPAIAGGFTDLNYEAAYALFMQFPNDDGLPQLLRPSYLFTNENDRVAALKLMTAINLNNSTNVLVGETIPIADPQLSDPNDWYLFGGEPWLIVNHEDHDPFTFIPFLTQQEIQKNSGNVQWDIMKFARVYPRHPFYAMRIAAA